MRFITEFEVPEKLNDYDRAFPRSTDWFIRNNKVSGFKKIGEMISESFGWQNPVNGNSQHHRLEIEAFPMDKWLEFRKRLLAALPDHDITSRIRIEHALHDLEHLPTKIKSSGQ